MFYPGSLWVKRLSHLSMLAMVGVNLFISEIHNKLYEVAEEMIAISVKLSDPAMDIAHMTEKSIVPALAYIENSSFRWIVTDYGVPSSQSLTESIHTAYRLKDTLDKYAPVYKSLSQVLKAINYLFWIPIGISALWVAFDIKKSKARYFDLLFLAGAILFNFSSYRFLCSCFPFF